MTAFSVDLSPKYAIEGVLGRGGMGVVVEARHVRLGHRVAIKVLGPELRAHPQLVARFEREARAAGALSSAHAVKVFDIDKTADGVPFMVMELLSGSDLGKLVEEHGPLPIAEAVRWVLDACDAIGEAHRLGIVHRDLKPSNLFLERSTGAIKVLDFGIAKRIASPEASITAGLVPLGTPQYMSPEQVRCAKDVDARTDIWSLGVTLYELLCGRPPWDHEAPQACIVAIVTDPVPDPMELRPDLPRGLADVLLRALAKDPAERFQSIDELASALASFAAARPTAPAATAFAKPRTIASPRRSRPQKRRVRSSLAIGAVALACLVGAFVRRDADASLNRTPATVPPLAGSRSEHVAPRATEPPKHAPSPPKMASVRPLAAATTRPLVSPVVHGGLSGPGF